MKNWYAVNTKAETPDEVEISIYDSIGAWGVTAQEFINGLKAIKAKNVLLTVNSPGGSVFDGFTMYNALAAMRASGVAITGRVMGIAASAASVVLMAANKIEMPQNSMMMVHYASTPAWGNAEELRKTASVIDMLDSSIVGIYTARTGRSEEDVRTMLKDETFLSADAAKEQGFADVVTENVKATASFELDRLPENVQALFKAAKNEMTPVIEEPKPTQQAVESTSVALAISDLAAKAGMPEFADVWALACDNIADAQNAITQAGEIRALCDVAKAKDKAAGFIRSATPLAQVRSALITARAQQDEATHTDTTRTNKESAPTTQQGAFSTEEIYAARRKATQR